MTRVAVEVEELAVSEDVTNSPCGNRSWTDSSILPRARGEARAWNNRKDTVQYTEFVQFHGLISFVEFCNESFVMSFKSDFAYRCFSITSSTIYSESSKLLAHYLNRCGTVSRTTLWSQEEDTQRVSRVFLHHSWK